MAEATEMALANAQDFTKMLTAGVTQLRANPSIGAAAFSTYLTGLGWTNEDWLVEQALLEAVEYVPAGSTFAVHRTFCTGLTNEQARAVGKLLVSEFKESTIGQIAQLKAQRDAITTLRNAVRDVLQNILIPWYQNPPQGTDPEIVTAVFERGMQRIAERDGYNLLIDQLDIKIAALGG